GTLGAAVLERVRDATYEGIDFWRPMLELAAERLAPFGDRARLHPYDLRDGGWMRVVRAAPDVILTNQALHDLGTAEAVEETYRRVRTALSPGGLFVNAELVVPEGGTANKAGKLPAGRHLALLQ